MLFNSIVLAETGTRIVVGAGPSGTTDYLARYIATKLSSQTNDPAIVENKPGSMGRIASDIVKKGSGNRLVIGIEGTSNFILVPLVDAKKTDKQPIYPRVVATIALANQLIVVHPSFPGKNLAEFIALARKQKNINIGTSGVGGIKHLILEHVNSVYKIDINHVPYKTSSGYIQETISGQIDGAIADEPSTTNLLQSGKLRGIAILSARRTMRLPNIPTAIEQGLDLVEPVYWAITVPINTPSEIITSIRSKFQDISLSSDFIPMLTRVGLSPLLLNTFELENLIASDRAKWSKIIANSQVKFE